MHNTVEWRRGGRLGNENRYEGRRGLIVRAARSCFGRNGVAKTSVADITREVGITRELFYYYFGNKDLVVESVIDSYINDARTWLVREIGTLQPGATQDDRLHAIMRALHSWLATEGELPGSMIDVLRETGYGPSVVRQVAYEAAVAFLGDGTSEAQDTSESENRKEKLIEGYRIVFAGTINALLCEASVEDESLYEVVQTLLV